MDRQYLSAIDEKAALLEEVANFLWDNPESAFTEFRSAYLCEVLPKMLHDKLVELMSSPELLAQAEFRKTVGP